MSPDHLISILEEQHSVGFTGKVNVLDRSSNQIFGHVIIFEGDISQCDYKGNEGLKAFYNLCIDEFDETELKYVVEPELVDTTKDSIHYPFSVLKRKITEVVGNYKLNKENRPPDHLKILIKPEFIAKGEAVDNNEYDLLCTLSDYNLVSDVYKHCDLFDYQITNTFVSLRKKNALTVIKNK